MFTNKTSKRVISLAISFTPMITLAPAARLFYSICYAILKDASFVVNPEEVEIMSPSHDHVRNIVSGAFYCMSKML